MEGTVKPLLYCSSASHAPNPIATLLPPTLTESELTAAEQLLQLSESSCTVAVSGCNSATSVSSSTRSVNAPVDDVTKDDEGLCRRNKRYRLTADLYASTVQLRGEGDGMKKKEKRRRKRKVEERDGDSFY